MIIHARAPLRLGLAGGGTDIPSYYERFGSYVINVTIDRYAHVLIQLHQHDHIHFVSLDQNITLEISTNSQFMLGGELLLHKAVYHFMVDHYHHHEPIRCDIYSLVDAPLGSGLGASSTLVVALIGAFSKLLDLKLDHYRIAEHAFYIERIMCGFAGGQQDYYAATFGGLNLIECEKKGITVHPINLPICALNTLESNILLYDTGVSRFSHHIITEQTERSKKNDPTSLSALHHIKQEALLIQQYLIDNNFVALAQALERSWLHKKQSAHLVSNKNIDMIHEAALQHGAIAGKISGAGGGGFMWFLVPIQHQKNVFSMLETFGGRCTRAHFTCSGLETWKNASEFSLDLKNHNEISNFPSKMTYSDSLITR